MKARKIDAMHQRFGTCGALQCRDCCHLISGEWHDKRYHKCELYGMSHSEATDWRLSYQACGMYNVPQDMDRWVDLIKQLSWQAKPVEPPLEGQMRLEV